MKYTALPGQLELLIATVSEGIGAAMAYDVSVRSRGLTLASPVDDSELATWRGEATLPVSSFVAHELRHHRSGKLAELSRSDTEQITTKTQKHLRQAFGDTLELELERVASAGPPELAVTEAEPAQVQVRVAIRGVGTPLQLSLSLRATSLPGGAPTLKVEGHGVASLAALGISKVKAPLGLLVVSDRVELTLRGTLTATS